MLLVFQSQAATLCGRKWSAISDCEPALPVDGCLEYPENKETAQELCSIISDVEGIKADVYLPKCVYQLWIRQKTDT